MTQRIDLNCDLGESFGAWRMGEDDAILPLISSASVACGFHAGDPSIMQRTVAQAAAHGVAIGAHVSLPDLQGFGRREMRVTPAEVYAMTLYQIGALHAFARAAGTCVAHVKPHGALYNMAARDGALAEAIARAVQQFDPRLRLFGLANSRLIDAARAIDLPAASEAFVDRRYCSDGSLQPRGEPGAVIENIDAAAEQAIAIARDGRVAASNGSAVAVQADTLCLHGDGAHALAFAHRLRQALLASGLRIAAPGAD
jgi:UPF0271 protein